MIAVLTTHDEPHVTRSVSTTYDADAREIVLHDIVSEDGERGAMTTLAYDVDDVPAVVAALMSEYSRVRFDADPRQMGMQL